MSPIKLHVLFVTGDDSLEQVSKIILADTSDDFRSDFAVSVAKEFDFELVGSTASGKELLNRTRALHPDVVIMDLILNEMDSLSVLENLSSMEYKPFIVICSSFIRGNMVELAISEGASCFLSRPISSDLLLLRVRQLMNTKVSSRTLFPNLEAEVTVVLKKMGIPAHKYGYCYLRRAIILAIEDSQIMKDGVMAIYTRLAQEYKSNITTINTEIFSAVKVGWSRMDQDFFDSYFSDTKYNPKKSPPSSDLISLVADRIRLQYTQGF